MPQVDPSAIDNNRGLESFDKALKTMLTATTGYFGDDFLKILVKELCAALNLNFAMVGLFEDESLAQVKSVAVFHNGQYLKNFSYSLNGTPCSDTVVNQVCCVVDRVQEQYPDDDMLVPLNARGYLGVALNDSSGKLIGILVTLSEHALHESSWATSILQVFASRAAAELERQAIIQTLQLEVSVNQAQLDSVPALMFIIDQQGRFLRWNKYYSSKFGYTNKQMRSQNVLAAVDQADRRRVELEIAKIFDTGEGNIFLNGITKDGDIVPLLTTARATVYEDKPVVMGVALDMTEQHTVERNLLRSQGRLARKNSQLSLINALVEKLHASHSIKHIAEEVVSLLKSVEEKSLLLFSVVSLSGEHMRIVASHNVELIPTDQNYSFDKPDSPTGIAMMSQRLEIFPMIANDRRIDPKTRQLLVDQGVKSGLVIPLIYQEEAMGGIIIGYHYDSNFPEDELEFYQTIGASISLALANARQFELLESLATHDNLTGLPNRNALNQDSRLALKLVGFNQQCVGLVLVDLDRFKEINDTLDHQIGDKLLKLIGPRIEQAINDCDTRIYRLGGDEFCVLVRNKTNTEEVEVIAELIRIAISNPFDVDGLNLEIDSSIGVFVTQEKQLTSSEMLRCVELAMYQAKNQGGGIAVYSPEMDADTNQRFVIMAEMAEAIRSDELVLHYQPKYDLKTRKIIGCEALVRWQHKKYGLLPPQKFIPLVELTQLILPLTFWVMKTAMQQLQAWKLQGIQTSIAVNLSTRNLTDDDFINQLDSLMKEFEISANEIEFEVTETALMSDLEQAMLQLNEFNSRGIRCSLDDYGTGYSSLSYIKQLPLDVLKIDQTFISQMLAEKTDHIIAQSTIDLAHNLGMQVIAEGVEDEETLNALISLGCDMVQGFYISKPLPAEKFSEHYRQHNQ